MKALVLAAGMSTRIASVSRGTPKPLLSIANRPVIARTLEWLSESGVGEVWINLHYRPNDIRDALGDGSRFGLRLHYAFEPVLLGTAGAFRALDDHWDDTTLVVYGDNIMRFDLAAFRSDHRHGGLDATIALFDPAVHANSKIAGGRVSLDGGAQVRAFVEGGSGAGLVNTGAYLFEPTIAREIGDGYQDFGHDVFPALADAGRLRGYTMERSGYCIGLDTPDSFRLAESLITSGQVALA